MKIITQPEPLLEFLFIMTATELARLKDVIDEYCGDSETSPSGRHLMEEIRCQLLND